MSRLASWGLQAAAALLVVWPSGVVAQQGGSVQLIANDGVLVASGGTKILFDPLFRESFGELQVPSDAQREALIAGKAPYDGVAAVFVSHMHGDHFDAHDLNRTLAVQPQLVVVAPRQVVARLQAAESWRPEFGPRVHALAAEFGAPAVRIRLDVAAIDIVSVRIPHGREVENLVHRVKLPSGLVVMHLGDADPDDAAFAAYDEVWAETPVDIGFPPYWFFEAPDWKATMDRLRVSRVIGLHVPREVPAELKAMEGQGVEFLHEPGEVREVEMKRAVGSARAAK